MYFRRTLLSHVWRRPDAYLVRLLSRYAFAAVSSDLWRFAFNLNQIECEPRPQRSKPVAFSPKSGKPDFVQNAVGPIVCDALLSGFILIGPGVHYPAHQHAPREIYLLMSPGIRWQLDHGDWFDVDPGDLIFHDSWRVHATKTDKTPCWRSSPGSTGRKGTGFAGQNLPTKKPAPNGAPAHSILNVSCLQLGWGSISPVPSSSFGFGFAALPVTGTAEPPPSVGLSSPVSRTGCLPAIRSMIS